ncbi:hypothetical protein ALC62_14334 [Cyphomyrmex costatus]|uniref:Peptidase A2 domain-containing protein n=1 Tax=Cyphomyrmex costatus TaxID=456900 RepID=A0A151I8P6_9HYME|nr:hypothetical protein ALC62_14333 [Cyphomyrmex costatus]KYM95034.1 hypothetical protein ALC62_14334 [Cyphomyrmex costatus]
MLVLIYVFFRENKIKRDLREFCYEGEMNDKHCIFKIDTGSDVLKFDRQKMEVCNCNVRYPTGEQVLVKYKVKVKVRLANYTLMFSILVAEINDDCILGVNFLRFFNLQNVFDTMFFNTVSEFDTVTKCSRIENIVSKAVPSNMTTPFKESSQYLNEAEKENFARFLDNFCGVFSDNVIAGNCKIGEHVINLLLSF